MMRVSLSRQVGRWGRDELLLSREGVAKGQDG